MPNLPDAHQSGRDAAGQTEPMVLDVHPGGAARDLRFGRSRRHEDKKLLVISEVYRYFDLPLYQSLSRIESQNDDDVLADDGDGVRLLVERKSRFDSEEVLKGQRRLGLSLLVAIFRISVQLQMQTICNEDFI